MNGAQSLRDFVASQSPHLSLVTVLINLALAVAMAFLLSVLYDRYGTSLSNRRTLSRNFILLTMTTLLVISVVKSSLALSLGLVGALSIVRFRAAIKEPEELVYLFICIAIGLGLGADQRAVTAVAFLAFSVAIMGQNLRSASNGSQSLYLSISSADRSELDLDAILEVLKDTCSSIQLRRVDESEDALETAFYVGVNNISALQATKDKIRQRSATAKVTFLDTQGLS